MKIVTGKSTDPSTYFDQTMKVHDCYVLSKSRNLMTLLGSYDTPRVLNLCKGNKNLASLGNESAIVVGYGSAASTMMSLTNVLKGSHRNIVDLRLPKRRGRKAILRLGPRSSAVYLKSGAN